MKILAVETSGKSFSAALNIDGQNAAEIFYNCGLIHSEKILETIENILKVSNLSLKDIDKFAVSAGPGSFTGIRVGLTVIKTAAQILNKPVVCLDCLTILEAAAIKIKGIKIIAAINALRDDIFIKRNGMPSIINIEVFAKSLRKHKDKILIIGDAALFHREIIKKQLGQNAVSLPPSFHFPKASVLAREALYIDGKSHTEIAPLYIRKSWAEENKAKKALVR
jgi:tRNA threonylcarbamoyl adenosine modification protein YeaZ